MIQSYAAKITFFLIKNEKITNEEKDVYQYGFETLLAFLANILVILLLSIFLGKLGVTIVFIACYSCLRQYTGGYHAGNYKKCLMLFIMLYTSNVAILELLMTYEKKGLIIIAGILSYIGICLIGPVECENNKLEEEQIKKYKKIVRYIATVILGISMLTINYEGLAQYSFYMSSSLILILIMMSLELVKRGEKNE
ncbi:MAG: accessory gene regulator B family protein [Sarcina sp.]